MNITIREYQDSDKDILQEMVEKLMDHVVSKDPIKRIRRMPQYGNVFANNLLETIDDSKYINQYLIPD